MNDQGICKRGGSLLGGGGKKGERNYFSEGKRNRREKEINVPEAGLSGSIHQGGGVTGARKAGSRRKLDEQNDFWRRIGSRKGGRAAKEIQDSWWSMS